MLAKAHVLDVATQTQVDIFCFHLLIDAPIHLSSPVPKQVMAFHVLPLG